MPNSDQSRIRTKPDPFHDLLDLRLDLGTRLNVFQLTTQTEEANLKYQSQLASGYEVGKSSTIVPGRSVFLAEKVGRLCPEKENVNGEITE
jgi:hypothetical protein